MFVGNLWPQESSRFGQIMVSCPPFVSLYTYAEFLKMWKKTLSRPFSVALICLQCYFCVFSIVYPVKSPARTNQTFESPFYFEWLKICSCSVLNLSREVLFRYQEIWEKQKSQRIIKGCEKLSKVVLWNYWTSLPRNSTIVTIFHH